MTWVFAGKSRRILTNGLKLTVPISGRANLPDSISHTVFKDVDAAALVRLTASPAHALPTACTSEDSNA
jgi:hypothetical protein